MRYFGNDGWLFPDERNKIHLISAAEILDLAKRTTHDDLVWNNNVKDELAAIEEDGEHCPQDIIPNMFRVQNVTGTKVCLPYGYAITFDCTRHFFRGENQVFPASTASLNVELSRDSDKSDAHQELVRTIWNLRIAQFANFIWGFNIVPDWETTFGDVNYKALAQHYGFKTHLLDLTNDFLTALFFATCKYDTSTDSYRPLTKAYIDRSEDTQFGVLYHTPNWRIDYNQPLSQSIVNERIPDSYECPIAIDSGILDGAAFQIGYQPFERCHFQKGYVYPMRTAIPLNEDMNFEKLRFKHSQEFSNQIFEMMDKGRRVFPHEGLSEVSCILDSIKASKTFTQEEVEEVYKQDVDKSIFTSKDSLLDQLAVDGFHIGEVDFGLSDEERAKINAFYDNKDLLKEIGGIVLTTPEIEETFRERHSMLYGGQT